jgi:hypothetical protein
MLIYGILLCVESFFGGVRPNFCAQIRLRSGVETPVHASFGLLDRVQKALHVYVWCYPGLAAPEDRDFGIVNDYARNLP